jgi:hypothetical protein
VTPIAGLPLFLLECRGPFALALVVDIPAQAFTPGDTSDTALLHTDPMPLTRSDQVKARVRSGISWSALVVGDAASLSAQYGTAAAVAGQYTGQLSNAGERIRLEDAAGQTILDFRYADERTPRTT